MTAINAATTISHHLTAAACGVCGAEPAVMTRLARPEGTLD
jgi:hypothetical protein